MTNPTDDELYTPVDQAIKIIMGDLGTHRMDYDSFQLAVKYLCDTARTAPTQEELRRLVKLASYCPKCNGSGYSGSWKSGFNTGKIKCQYCDEHLAFVRGIGEKIK